MASSVAVIEAPGKVNKLASVLRGIGKPMEVIATGGHFMAYPGLSPLGITWPTGEEPGRLEYREVGDMLRRAARGKNVYIATDDDQEGGVIACDVHRTVSPVAVQCLRVKLSEFSRTSVQRAFTSAVPVDLREGSPGKLRRLMDRLIGSGSSSKAVLGRVVSSLLGSVERQPLPIGEYQLEVPAADQGAPFRARVPYYTLAGLELWKKRERHLQEVWTKAGGAQVFSVYKPAGGRLPDYSQWVEELLRRAL